MARTPPRAAWIAAISFGTMPPSKLPSASPASASSARSTCATDPATSTPGHVADEHDPLGAEPDGESGCSLVRVHVERPFGQRRDDRHASCGEGVQHRRGRDRHRVADEAESVDAPRAQPDRVAGETDCCRADRGAHLRVDGAERRPHHLEDLRCGDASPADEPRRDAAALQLLGDLRAGAVHDDGPRACLGECGAD